MNLFLDNKRVKINHLHLFKIEIKYTVN